MSDQRLRFNNYKKITTTMLARDLVNTISDCDNRGTRWLIVDSVGRRPMAMIVPYKDVVADKQGGEFHPRPLLETERLLLAQSFAQLALIPALGEVVEKKAFFRMYEEWCKRKEVASLLFPHFGRAVKEAMDGLLSARVMRQGRRFWAYRDVSSLDLAAIEAKEEQIKPGGDGDGASGASGRQRPGAESYHEKVQARLLAGWTRGEHGWIRPDGSPE